MKSKLFMKKNEKKKYKNETTFNIENSINNIKYNIVIYIIDNLFFIKLQIDIVKI